jgi:hypothetical protein
VEVIPWKSRAGQYGVAIQRDAKVEAYFVGTEAEREARRKRDKEARREPAEGANSKGIAKTSTAIIATIPIAAAISANAAK